MLATIAWRSNAELEQDVPQIVASIASGDSRRRGLMLRPIVPSSRPYTLEQSRTLVVGTLIRSALAIAGR